MRHDHVEVGLSHSGHNKVAQKIKLCRQTRAPNT
jgi:hypothetical protein